MRRAAISIAVIIIIAVLGFFLWSKNQLVKSPLAVEIVGPTHEVIGQSVQGRTIDAYTYGMGSTTIAFVGGIHGGYEWNSVLLAYTFMDYIVAHPEIIPKNLSVIVIPDANPDAVFKVVGKEGSFTLADIPPGNLSAARFNADQVDLNRNFACKWQATSTWQNKTVSGGTLAFSEPESRTIRDFALKNKPSAMVFWHSAAGAVYASQCGQGILPDTLNIMNLYAKAGDYPAVKVFDSYPTTGAADDWLSTIGIPAITVELKTHDTIEWDKNLAGIKALLTYYGQH